MKEKLSNKVKEIAKETMKHENEFIIQQIMRNISLNLDEEKNIIAKIRIGKDLYDIWKPGKDGKYIVINTTSYKQNSTLYLSKKELMKQIVLKAFFNGNEYIKIAKKLNED
jgi:hypothetical protein